MSRAANELSIPLLVTAIVAVLVLLWAGGIALEGWFHAELAAETQRKVVEQPIEELEQRLAEQRSLLDGYELVDRETGQVRLPIERAMELVASEDRATRDDREGKR